MVKIDLITGFLGSGKTTFIKKYADYLMRQGYDIGILENDYGAINVDMMLLQELEGEHCELEMVSGGCCQDSDAHRRRFKTKLISMGMCGYDRILVEPSGVFDMDEFFDTLQEEPLDQWYRIGSVITIVDARLEDSLSEEADYVLASEAAHAGCIVLSRTQVASEAEQRNTLEHLNQALEHAKCSRRFQHEHIMQKNWEEFTDADFEKIAASGYEHASYVKQGCGEHGGFESLFFMNLGLDEAALLEVVQEIFSDPACGTVFRVKGFFPDGAKGWKELNMTKREHSVQPIRRGQEVLIVIGEHLDKGRLEVRFAQVKKEAGIC